MRSGRRIGIAEKSQHRRADVMPQQFGQYTRGVAGASTARVVLGVGDDDRLVGTPGDGHGFFDRLALVEQRK